MKKTIIGLLALFIHIQLFAVETRIIVRAKAKDAKFIGSSIGGAHVLIRNVLNGQLLAEGKTSGSTGNTDLIMKTAKERYQSVTDEQTAKFLAVLDIDEPVYVNIEVLAPANNKQAQAKVSTSLWLIPGKHLLGDGIILEVPGFVIDVLKPRTHQYIALKSVMNTPFEIAANIVMMCGCTISEGGIWDAQKIEVKALIKRNETPYKEVTMKFADTNLFKGELIITEQGRYEVMVYAYDLRTGNTGVDKVNYVVYE
ncbi:hypothetical protein [Ascidiimonas aurantiaca]|uniref:hypothetical protein n=1 Tax=Ascidiimonas aurantiaca TaxID=1685432 RepID=UPI0030EEA54F